MKRGDCPSQYYAEGLFAWVGIKLSEAPYRNIGDTEDLSPTEDAITCCRKLELTRKQAILATFQCHSRNRETRSNELSMLTIPSTPVTGHTRYFNTVHERV